MGEWGYRSSDERVPVTVLTARGKAYGIEYWRHERLVRQLVAGRPPLARLDEGPVIERPGRGGIVMGEDLGGAD